MRNLSFINNGLRLLSLCIIVLIQIQTIICSTCPLVQTFHNPQSQDGFEVKSFLNIPQTNLLIINTVSVSKGSSIVYYNDMQSSSGEIINIIKPDFLIIEMSYIEKTDRLLISNYEKIFVADPYSLRAEQTLSMSKIKGIVVVKNTNYAILTMKYNQINILEVSSLSIKKTLDNSKFTNTLGIEQFISKLYKLSTQENVIFCLNSRGVFTWTIDFSTLKYQYNDYIDDTTDTLNKYKSIEKHPSKDILFVGGKGLEVKVILLQDIKAKKYQTLKTISLYDGKYSTYYSKNIAYKEIKNDIFKNDLLLIGDGTNIYHLNIEITDQNQVNTINEKDLPWDYELNTIIYSLDERKYLIMASQFYVTIYNYEKNQTTYNLYFFSDNINRRVMYQSTSEESYLMFKNKDVALFKRGQLGLKYGLIQMQSDILEQYNSIYKIKDCDGCFFAKTSNAGGTDVITIIALKQSKETPQKELDITTKFSLNWSTMSLNLDPFMMTDNKIYVVVGFPTNVTGNNLFKLINVSSEEVTDLQIGVSYVNAQTSYAVVSIEYDQILGVDTLGNIHVWTLSTKTYLNSYQIGYECKNSEIGDLFVTKDKEKYFVMACDNYNVIIYNFQDGSYTNLITLTSSPLALKIFLDAQVIAVGDTNQGVAYIYKFNKDSKIFESVIEIQSGTMKETLIAIDILMDNTIWVQYINSNIFYQLDLCLENSSNCINCNQESYFKISNEVGQTDYYGSGLQNQQYTTSTNFMTAMLKAQLYINTVKTINNMNVSIKVDPQYPMDLRKGLLTFEFTSTISLDFVSTDSLNKAVLQVSDELVFQDYNKISLSDISISFKDLMEGEACGLVIKNIKEEVQIKDFSIFSDQSSSYNCNIIKVYSSLVSIDTYIIENQNLSTHHSVISTFDTKTININNFTLRNCEIGRNFSILSQLNNVSANLNIIKIEKNYCSTKGQDESIATALFNCGLFTVNDFKVLENTFCNTVIFSTQASIDHLNQVFKFEGLTIQDNNFSVKTNYILLSALYSMRTNPLHEIYFKNLIVQNNILSQSSVSLFGTVNMIQTSKITKVQFDVSKIINQTYLFLSAIDQTTNVIINDMNCSNDLDYFNKIPTNKATAGCMKFSEIGKCQIKKLTIQNKAVYDTQLILFESYQTKTTTISINGGQFTNNQLIQFAGNVAVNVVQVIHKYKLSLTLTDCHYLKNSFTAKQTQYSLSTLSSTALAAEYLTGLVKIENSTFDEQSSNSNFNSLIIKGDEIDLDNVQFTKSSYADVINNQSFLLQQYGGNMYLSVSIAFIVECTFSQSTAYQGAFIYAEPNGSSLEMQILDSHFSEGYASNNGGAIFLYPSKMITFVCERCYFNNIFTLNIGISAAIGIENSATTDKVIHSFDFLEGGISNIYGNGDNYFIKIERTDLQIKDFEEIKVEPFNSKIYQDLIKEAHSKDNKQQLAQLVDIKDSTFTMDNCNVDGWNQLNTSSIPLLINSVDSTVTIKNSVFKNGKFKNSAISHKNKVLNLESVEFLGFSQVQLQQRQLETIQDQSPIFPSNGLIQIQNSALKITKKANFENIQCTQNCNGSALQLLNTSFQISNLNILGSYVRTKFQFFGYSHNFYNKKKASFGGALFVYGFTSAMTQNFIKSSVFTGNKAQYDGGSIYLYTSQQQKYSLVIDGCEFTSNESISRDGGALFIYSEYYNPPIGSQSIAISDSKINQNTAQVGGGIKNLNISPLLTSTTFDSNIGIKFGSDQMSYPTSLFVNKMDQFLKDNPDTAFENNMLVFKHFRSGALLPKISFKFKNGNDIIYPLNEEQQNYYSIQVGVYKKDINQQYDASGEINSKYDKDDQSFTFDEVKIIGQPGSSAFFEFTSNQIKLLNPELNQYTSDYTFMVKVQFRNCTYGEELQTYQQLVQCSICPVGFYSLDTKGCLECPKGAYCEGGSSIVANEGYWRKSNISDIILDCSNALSNCVGGSQANQICFEGHIGALCEECDIYGEYWNSSYSKSGEYTCQNCDTIKYNSYIVVLMTIWTLISMTIAIRGDIDILENKAGALAIQKHLRKSRTYVRPPTVRLSTSQSSFGNSKEDEERAGVYIKMLTNYLQIVGSISTFNLTLPSGIFSAPESVGQPLKQTMNSLDCALQNLDSEVPIIYLRLMFQLLIPLIYLILFMVILAVIQIFKKGRSFPWYVLWTAIMFLVIYVQPDLVSQVIGLLSCRTIGDTKYILANVAFECYTEDHNAYSYYFLIPTLLVWIMILPGILLLLLKRKKRTLDNIQTKLKYGFLYKEYTNKAFYWEFIKMGEKIVIILALNFFFESIVVKGLIVFMIIVIYGLLSNKIKPYQEEFINQIDVNSTNISAVSILLGIFIYDNNHPYLVIMSFIALLIINAWFILGLIKKIASGYVHKLKELKKTAIEFLASKFDYFKKYLPEKKPIKQMNPVVRDKMRKIFFNFIKMPPKQKRAIILKIVESQLTNFKNSQFDQIKQTLLKSIDKDPASPKQTIPSTKIDVSQSEKKPRNEDSLNKEIDQPKQQEQLIKFDSLEDTRTEVNMNASPFYNGQQENGGVEQAHLYTFEQKMDKVIENL